MVGDGANASYSNKFKVIFLKYCIEIALFKGNVTVKVTKGFDFVVKSNNVFD